MSRINEASIIAKQMAYNAVQQYKLGEEDLQSQLMGDYPQQTQSDTVSVINPRKVIPLIKHTTTVSGPKNGYNAKAMTQSSIPVEKVNPNMVKAKDFIAQTRVLDNDMDYAIGLMQLNNKDEFYGGTLFTEQEKKHYDDNATTEELEELWQKLMDEMLEKDSRGEDTTDDYDNIKFLEKILLADSIDPSELIRNLGKFKDLDSAHDRELAEIVLSRNAKGKKVKADQDTIKALNELGYAVNRDRKGEKLKPISDQDIYDTYTGKDEHRKSKKGVRVIETVHASKITNDVLLISKKIANDINTLIPLAQTMTDTRYQGITHADKLMMQEIYQDIDEKLYILTSVNNVDNTIFIKLDKNYDKLYDTVKRGLDSYNGGSMLYKSYNSDGPGVRIPPAHSYVKCDNWQYL